MSEGQDLSSTLLSLNAKKTRKADRELVAAMLPKYWAMVSQEFLKERDSADLLKITQEHLKLARSRKRDHSKLHCKRDDEHDCFIIEIVSDDMPFLFDSISNALHRMSCSIRLAVHPVLWCQRDGRGRLLAIADQEVPAKDDEPLYRAEAIMRFEVEAGYTPLTLKQLESQLLDVLSDVKEVVAGWQAMRSKAAEIRFGLEKPHLPIDETERSQACAFFEWIEDNNFTFISYSRAKLEIDNDGKPDLKTLPRSRMGLKIDASPWSDLVSSKADNNLLNQYLSSPNLLVITKANQRSPVHRNAWLDYIAIKDYDNNGVLQGEHRFFGLFTRSAYNSRALDIPLLKTRIHEARARARFPSGSHNSKMLLQVLETFPRDELFQSTVDELFDTAMGVLALEERHRVRVFQRIDPFHRFFSLLIYLPRDRYSQSVREKIQSLIASRARQTDMEFNIHFNESLLARLQLIVRVEDADACDIDVLQLEQDIEHVTQDWSDGLHNALRERLKPRQASQLFSSYHEAFTPAYEAKTDAKTAATDVLTLQEMADKQQSIRARLMPQVDGGAGRLQIRVYFKEQPMALADAQPRLANLGMRLVVEDLFPVQVADAETTWIQDFRVETDASIDIDCERDSERFEAAFIRMHQGLCEDDWFNRLILSAGLDWHQTGVIRAYSRYLKQLGIRFGQIYISETLNAHADVTRLLVELFEARFQPRLSKRDARIEQLQDSIDEALDQVSNLDADRILRNFRNVINATLRCNVYQRDEQDQPPPYYSFKIATGQLHEAPRPRPAFEIWVHSPRFEAVHLRGGKVARGGLRWSDRPEDFRTEILGLVKAQIVKNAVIVPVGAKGGFVCRKPPEGQDRRAHQQEAIACYRQFMTAMLSLTDNLVDGKVVPPKQVVRWDDDDPYLVVAADKGTASFSDIANEIAIEREFWIGDAFASGGSNGYDHKKMGITAAGAWESVKRHFRELGTDIQQQPFTVIGIGDMSGDVFGNGMLMSPHIRLKAAFNHLHIMIDPDPDPQLSFKERQRQFNEVSHWADYDRSTLSKGGGIWSRDEKSIKPSQAACRSLEIEHKSYTPDELIHALLQAPVDLLWNGGIGTYVKGENESHEQVGDRANESLRVNGHQLRCKVVGEGGNLGMTQLARIEYSLNGGRCNTDSIDNAGGVDSSDHEVNIKIALNTALQAGALKPKQRNQLLKDMTEAVRSKVLRNNYLQSQAISVMHHKAKERLGEQWELIRLLERDASLDRKLEALPDEKALEARQAAGLGLTRPEIAVLLSYAKIDLFKELLASDVPEDPYLSKELLRYFPERLTDRYGDVLTEHPLKREIIATRITNSLINRMGATFAHRLHEEIGAGLGNIARAYTIARDVYEITPLWKRIESLDNRISAELQLELMLESRRLIKHTTLWLLQNGESVSDIEAMVKAIRPTAELLEVEFEQLMPASEAERYQQRLNRYQKAGIPEDIARRVTKLKAFYPAPDIHGLSERHKQALSDVASCYFQLAERLQLGWIRRQIDGLQAETRWQALARNALRDDLYSRHQVLTGRVLKDWKNKVDVNAEIEAWCQQQDEPLRYFRALVKEVQQSESSDYLSLSVLLRQLSRLSL